MDPGTDSRTVVIVGGGVGGLVAANSLRHLLPDRHRVLLIEPCEVHAYAPSYLWAMTGRRAPARIATPVRRLVRPGVEIVVDAARRIDTSTRMVHTSARAIAFDFLILAAGAELAPELVPGLAASACSFYTFEAACRLPPVLDGFTGGRVAVVVCSLPYKCPAAPHEAAMLLADFFRRRGRRKAVAIDLYTPEPRPMPVAGSRMGEAVMAMLAARGVGFHALHRIVSVDGHDRMLHFEGVDPVPYDLLIAIPPHRAPQIARESGLANAAGWVPVDRTTLETAVEGVFAIGDITAIELPGRYDPAVPLALPKAGVFAHEQAQVVSERIAAAINGTTPNSVFDGRGYCMLEAGGRKAGLSYGDFFGVPTPTLAMRAERLTGHVGKVLLERWWLSPFGLRRAIFRQVLKLGTALLRIPIRL